MKTLPSDIERGSMAIIAQELRVRGITLPPENAAVVMRCIHASADFDYAENLRFTPGGVGNAVEALQKGIIAGAALDVFEHEPHITEALLGLDNVVLSPHIGTGTMDGRLDMCRNVEQNISAFLDDNLDKMNIVKL